MYTWANRCSDTKAAILGVLFLWCRLGMAAVAERLDTCFMMLLLMASLWAWHRAMLAEEDAEGGHRWLIAVGAALQALMVLGRYGWWWSDCRRP